MLTLQFVPYSEIENLDTNQRIKKLLDIVKDKNVVLMQGRLKPEEETKLIQQTMEEIDKEFKGVELCTIYPEDKEIQAFKKFKREFFKFVIGNREGMTIIGPASVIKEIKRDPDKIQLMTFSTSLKKKTGRKK